MTTIKEVMIQDVPPTNIESWILLGNKKTVEVTLGYENFPHLYKEKPISDFELKTVFMRGLSMYEFNTCLFDTLKIIDDDVLTNYVTTADKLSIDIRNVPPGVSSAVFKQFIFELDYLLIWNSMRDFHYKERKINDETFKTKISIEDVRKFDGIRKLAIVVYFLSGYVKEVPEHIRFFRDHGEGAIDRHSPLPSESPDNAKPA